MIEHNGKKYARVSYILKAFSDFSHIDPGVLANKARIGTSVHQAIADDIAGRFPCADDDALGYYDSYEKWRNQVNPFFVESETRYFDDNKMITGQIDAIVNLSEGSQFLTLVDFKTSAQESKETWLMQAHLYAYLLKKNDKPVHQRYLFVKLDKNGSLPQVCQYFYSSSIHLKCMKAIDDFWKYTGKR